MNKAYTIKQELDIFVIIQAHITLYQPTDEN